MSRGPAPEAAAKLADVRIAEVEEIATRRQKAGLRYQSEAREEEPASPGDAPKEESGGASPFPKNLVGLSLSGGGIRSACVGLGLIQALHKTGLIRFIDYLSTVSGGGYVGSHLSSYFVNQDKTLDKEEFDLKPDEGGKQPPRILHFVYGGHYLNKPWQFIDKYLIGLVFNNLAIVSGLFALTAGVAFLWRCLDYEWARDITDMVALTDVHVPFLPFFFFLFCWVVAWFVAYLRRSAQYSSRLARILLALSIVSLLIGIVVVIGNGDVALGTASADEDSAIRPTGSFGQALLIALLTALIPLINPKRLLQSGTRPRKPWEYWVFRVTSFALIVGIPLFLVYFFARENIAGYWTQRDPDLDREDIQDWHSFAATVGVKDPSSDGGTEDSSSDGGTEDPSSDGESVIQKRMQAVLDASKDFKNAQEEFEGEPGWERFRLPDRFLFWLPHHRFWRAWQTVNAPLSSWLGGDSNPAAEYWSARERQRRAEDSAVKEFNQQVLESSVLYRTILDESEPAPVLAALEASGSEKNVLFGRLLRRWREFFRRASISGIFPFAILQLPPEPSPSQLKEFINTRREASGKEPLGQENRLTRILDKAEVVGVDGLEPHERKRLNRRLLEARYPSMFYDPDVVQRRIVIYEDQRTRLKWFFWSLVVFGACGLWINVNATSLHRFYRNKLAHAFIEPKNGEHNAALSRLKTTDYGAPYHLINASATLLKQWARQPEHPDDGDALHGLPRDRRYNDGFVFSQRFCGSQMTGYRETPEYENYLRENISLADATALSAAAVSSGAIDNWVLAFLMLVFNVRLGQWLPNPQHGRPRFGPRMISLLRDFFQRPQNRDYCFVSDGGFTENLGLVSLLKRRCRLIIALDAGHDPEHHFTDFARAMRIAQLHGGVEIVALNEDQSDEALPAHLRPHPLELTPLDRLTSAHYLVARIRYPAREENGLREPSDEGLLIYLKSSMTGDESLVLEQYRRETGEFPHHSTTDLLYDETQVECYRRLGFHMGEDVCRMLSQALLRQKEADFWSKSELTDADLEGLETQLRALADKIEAQNPDRETLRKQRLTREENLFQTLSSLPQATERSSKRLMEMTDAMDRATEGSKESFDAVQETLDQVLSHLENLDSKRAAAIAKALERIAGDGNGRRRKSKKPSK